MLQVGGGILLDHVARVTEILDHFLQVGITPALLYGTARKRRGCEPSATVGTPTSKFGIDRRRASASMIIIIDYVGHRVRTYGLAYRNLHRGREGLKYERKGRQ